MPATPALPESYPTAVGFLDETGSISQDRFFTVGLLVLRDPALLLRGIQKVRDQMHWYSEIKWAGLTHGSLPALTRFVDLLPASGVRFAAFVADRSSSDPIARFGDPWTAYARLAQQLVLGACQPNELMTLLLDNYSTPDGIDLPGIIRADVNRRLGGLAVTTACNLDSKSTDGLQMVDLLTGAITFEFRLDAGLAGASGPKAQLAEHVRRVTGVTTYLGGTRNGLVNVKLYRRNLVPTAGTRSGRTSA